MDENDINDLSESERRFILDLEFVQCLSNVGYLKCKKSISKFIITKISSLSKYSFSAT